MIRWCIRLTLAGMLLGVVATAAPGHASARASSSSCSAGSHARGSRIVARDGQAVVFLRRGVTYDGCLYGHSVLKLSNICCEGERVRLAGHFVAYTYTGTAIGDETNKLGVYNLRTRRVERIVKRTPNAEGPGREIETSSFVPAFRVTSHGALIWLQDILTSFDDPNCASCETGKAELRVADGTPPRERVVDSGKIPARSLKVARNERSISYTNNGRKVHAALRR